MPIRNHYEHEIEIARYGTEENPVNFAIECVTCFEVLADEEMEELTSVRYE